MPDSATTSNLERDSGAEERDRFTAFAAVWSLAILLHQVDYATAFASLPDAVLTLAAVWTLLRPGSTLRVGVQACATVAVVWRAMPTAQHHWFLAGLVALTIGIGLAANGLPSRRSAAHDSLEAQVCVPLRWVAILVYVAAGVAKLNADYFYSATSCGLREYGRLTDLLPFLPTSATARQLGIWLGPAMELLVPALLIRRHGRIAAATIAVVFHALLGSVGYARFSTEMYALVILFLPATAISPVVRGARALFAPGGEGGLRRRLNVRLIACVALATLVAWTVIASWTGTHGRGLLPRDLTLAGFGLISLGATIWLGWCLLARTEHSPPPSLGLPYGPTIIGPLLVVLSALAPYLGAGTLQSFTMYSNLRTEGGSTNHFFLPRYLQALAFQDDLVVIVSSNVGELRKVADKGLALPYVELRQTVQRAAREHSGPVDVTYRRGDTLVEVPDASADPTLAETLPWPLGKLLYFRPVELSGPRACTT